MSCLFNSLNYFIKDNSHNIRQKICDYLQNNNKIIDGLETSVVLELDSPNYVENMRRDETMGGAIEIQSACNIWNLQIVVINNRDKETSNIEFLPYNGIYDKTIQLIWTGGHYEPGQIVTLVKPLVEDTLNPIDNAPNLIDNTPNSVDNTPNSVDNTLNSVDNTPNSVDNTPNSVDNTPNSVDNTSNPVDNTPNLIKKIDN